MLSLSIWIETKVHPGKNSFRVKFAPKKIPNQRRLTLLITFQVVIKLTPGPSKLEKVVDPGSGPWCPLLEIGVHYLNLDFQGVTSSIIIS